MANIYEGKGRALAAAVVLLVCTSTIVATTRARAEDPVELQEVIDVISQTHDQAREALGQLPRDQFETASVLESTDYDLEAVLTWFEQNTRWVPYQGVLRGANGVLLDRTGNSLDRSLLLAQLIGDAGHETRLVRGQLSADAVTTLLRRKATSAASAPTVEPLFVTDLVDAAAGAPSEAAALAKLIGPLHALDRDDAQEAAANHWWVEAKVGGEWTTVDPLLRGSMEAMRSAPVERLAADSLPESLYHTVTIRVVIERWSAGETFEEVPFEYTLRTADAAYQNLELQFVPFEFEPAVDGSTAVDEATSIADTAKEWLPVLRIGTETIQQQGFNHRGNLVRSLGRVAVARKAEQATSALQNKARNVEQDLAELTALWLEYRVEVPGREQKVLRREVFDLIGPARRHEEAVSGWSPDATAVRERGLSLLGAHRVVVVGVDLPAVALRKSVYEYWAKHGPQIADILRVGNGADDDEVLQSAYAKPLPALDLLGLAAARHVLSPNRASIYIGSPNVLTSHLMVELERPYLVSHAYDIVVNDVGVLASDVDSRVRIRIEQGVLDTILEAAMLESNQPSRNAAVLFSLRGNESGDWRRVVHEDLSEAALSDEATARIAGALNNGRIVVAPGRLQYGFEPAWWEIDSKTGTTLGIGYQGWGNSTPTDLTMRTIVTSAGRKASRKLGFNISCTTVGADLITAGLIRVLPRGGMLLSPEAMRMLLQYGCRTRPRFAR